MKRFLTLSAAVLLAQPLASSGALAYVGPGAGLGMIGSLIGVVIAVLLALLGLVYYPLRRILTRRRKLRNEGDGKG